MLRGMRKASTNWLGRIVMAVMLGMIAVSFAIWGIGDIFRGFGRSTVAKIGRTEITIEQFRSLYNDRMQQYSRQFGRPITPEQARVTGLDRVGRKRSACSAASCAVSLPQLRLHGLSTSHARNGDDRGITLKTGGAGATTGLPSSISPTF